MHELRSRGLLAGAGLLLLSLVCRPVQPQNEIAPMSIMGQSGIVFAVNSCTNLNTGVGAYSNMALASPSLGELSQSSTQDSTRTTITSIGDRRTTEAQSCRAGYTPVGGTCVPVAPPVAPGQTPGGTSMP